ncbi:response regulator transcription factor [Clostridium sp.]|uniref:response regulator transcription factor n=1 Tax=Clostridium sp. TaxID=1506 RepID=UPI002FDCB08D
MKKILIVEDNTVLSTGLKFDLEREGYETYAVYNSRQAKEIMKAIDFDLIVLDINLPDGSGFELCKWIKKLKDMPLIFLTACDMEKDAIKGFELGADDYITKPFNMEIFRRRIAAVLKRCERGGTENIYNDGYLMVDFDKLMVIRENKTFTLTSSEYKLLKIFAANGGKVLTRQVLLQKLWDNDGNFVDEHALTVNVNRIRNKIESKAHKYIKTVYGMGYMWVGESFNG